LSAARLPRAGLALLAAALVAACASVAPQGGPAPVDAAGAAVPFDVDGRLSARRAGEGGAANFAWHHDGTRDEVDLATPLGQTLARLTGDAQGVRAQWPDGRTLQARDWDELTQRTVGVAIPVQGLSAWLRGYARAGSPSTVERDAQGRVALLRQDGWEIVYAYPADDARRADRLTLRYPGTEPTEVRVIVDRWNE
jgi:outer membrane lipoprotein LolB